MNKISCINVKSKEFRDLCKKYDVSPADAELAIQEARADKNINSSINYNEDDFERFIKLKFFTDPEFTQSIHQNLYGSKSFYDKASKIWMTLPFKPSDSPIKTKKEATDLYKIASRIFGSAYTRLFKNNDGMWKVNVAAPSYVENRLLNIYRKYDRPNIINENILPSLKAQDKKLDSYSKITGVSKEYSFLQNAISNIEAADKIQLVGNVSTDLKNRYKRLQTRSKEYRKANKDIALSNNNISDKELEKSVKTALDYTSDYYKFIHDYIKEIYGVDTKYTPMSYYSGEYDRVSAINNYLDENPIGEDNAVLSSGTTVEWGRKSDNGYEVSSKGDKRFSALNAKFKKGTIIDGVDVSGKTIEYVYQKVIKKSGKGKAPSKDSKIYIDKKNFGTTFRGFNKEVISVEYGADDIAPRIVFKSPSGQIGLLFFENSKWNVSRRQKAPNGDMVFYTETMPKEEVQKFVDRYVPKKFQDYINSGQIYKDNKADAKDNGERVNAFFRDNYNIHFINEYFSGKSHESFEDFSYYEGYLPLWQEWARQNPDLIEDLREKSRGKVLTDQFATTRVSQARALADILNDKSFDSAEAQPNRKTYKGMINSLKDNQIFVFGSNTQGRHGAGAAKTARDKFGAKYGQAEGIQGKSFAIITKDLTKDDGKNPSRTRAQIEEQIHQLYEYARKNPNKEFLVAYSSKGRNLNYYSNEDMASMFASEDIPSNIVFEEGFNELVNKASSTSSKQKSTTKSKKTTDISKLQKATDTLNRIIEDTEEHITFDPKAHEYFIDGKKVDMSVTQYIHGNSTIDEKWSVPSTRIGNTVDRFVRAYFKGEDVFSLGIPNLSHEGAVALEEDLDKLKSYFDKKFGVDDNGNPLYKVITDEIHIAGKYRYINDEGKSVTKTIAGTPDMIIIDKNGNFHILDMKTKRTNSSSVWRQDTERSYYQQVSMYKAILEASYPELKGKIKDMNLIRFDVKYPTPSGITNQYGDDIGIAEYDEADPEDDIDTLYVSDDTMDHYVPIEDYDGYSSPRLSVIANNGLFKVSEIKPEGEVLSYNTLSPDEKDAIDEEIGSTPASNPAEQTEVEKQVNALYNPGILPASERIFLGNTAMSYVSFLITQLQTSPEANSALFGDEFSSQDFTKMSREDIVNTIKVSKLLNYVKERYFNPDNRVDIEDFDVLDKLQVAYDNWGALIQSAYSKLISLENTTVIKTAPNEINTEDLDADDTDWMEGATLEEKEREYYQLGQRQISARSSLSADIKRAFERLPVVDKEGNYLADKYGYNFITFVDAGEATNRIFDWVQDCTSIDEMENILREKSSIYPWLNNIIDKIQKEPFRSLFYQNFRKPFTKYSIVTVKKDADGNRSYEVNVINTKGASEALLDGIVNAYNSGIVNNIIIPIKGDLEGKGRVNVDKVQELKELNSGIISKLQKAHSDRRLNKALPSEIDNIAKLLTDIGIPVESTTLKEAFNGDPSRKNFNNTNVYSVLNEINYLLSTVLDNKKNKEYNPLEKGIDGNIYGNYRNIIRVLSKYIQDSIESSTYENGKMHYSFTTPSYMSKLVTNLKNALGDPVKFKKFIQKEYGSYRFFKDGDTWKLAWLDKLANSEEARQQFDYKVQLAFDGTPYTDLSEVGYTLSLLSEYFYDKGTKARNKKLAWFRIPMLANKPSSEFIRFTRYTGRNYKRFITEGLRDVFDQEVMRIQTVLERAINPNVNKIGVKDKITFDLKDSMVTDALKRKIRNKSLTINDFVKKGSLAFHGSGAEFKFLEALNNEFINKTELGQMIIDKINGKDVNEAVFNDKFSEAINDYMDVIVDREMKNWESIGLFDKETREVTDRKGNKDEKTVYKYLDKLGIGESEDEIKGNLEEYVWNDLFATINIIELTATDLAYYKNVEDFQKRYAQVHSPAMRLNVSARDANGNLYAVADPDGTVYERTIYLKDNIKVSDIIPNIEKALNDRIATLSGQEKNYMKMMKDLIISSFKEVNVADAQGYSSPTSYRKKLGMMGRWTTDMEEAYERITSGNYNVNDLGVVWQPLKPFVYSQIRKPSGASAMSELKVPVQNKNSEYLLFLADAIMRGNKQNNKLIAIFDFMEDSAWDGRVSKEGKVIKKGVYNGRGIDTVQFESAVNSGSMGAIDLNGLNTYDEIKEALNNAVYYNDNKEYNDQYVHAIPFEDYGIQQEVPAHLVDHEQLMGSQVRILSISDMTSNDPINVNGEEIAPSDLVNEYQNLIAENIRDSFDQLIKDFHLKGNRAEKNRALSNLLTEAILKDQRYGSDLLRACSLNEDGEFVIPINDPIQSIRIQQLLNSIIKTRINKQKVKGGPVVQASSFGLSEDLNIRFKDKNGNILDTFEEFKKKHRTSKNIKEAYDKYLDKNQYSIAYFECYMPIPSESLEKALTKKDGTLMSMEEAVSKGIITEDMRKAIGYRI